MSDSPAQPQLRVDQVTKRYGEQRVVDELSFELYPGECLGVIGPNGAGKTTTFRMCLGLSQPDQGSIEFFGMPMPPPRPGWELLASLMHWTRTLIALKISWFMAAILVCVMH